MAVRSYGLDRDFGYVCTVTLILEIWPWIKAMTQPWVMDKKLFEMLFRSDKGGGEEKLWPGHNVNSEQIDRQMDRQSDFYTTPNFCCRLPLLKQTQHGLTQGSSYLIRVGRSHFSLQQG